MIQINLLPGARRSKAAARQSVDFGALVRNLSGKFKDKFAIGAAVAVVVAFGTVGVLFLSQRERKRSSPSARKRRFATRRSMRTTSRTATRPRRFATRCCAR